MLDAVDRLPAVPARRPSDEGHQAGDEDGRADPCAVHQEPFSALAFKVATHPFFGKLTYVRVYSGQVATGAQVVNSTKGKKERIGKLFQMHSNKENPVEQALAGHIYAVIGLKDTTTGDTLCDPNEPGRARVDDLPRARSSRSPSSPRPRATRRSSGRRSRSSPRRTRPSRSHHDEETGQTIIAGMGELHLDILVDRMRREFKVEANVGKPQVAYRETIRRAVVKYDYTHKKQTGGSGQFAKVQVSIEPLDTSEGELYEFENKVTGGRVPREYIPSVDHGIQDAMQYGVLAGYPLVGRQGDPARRWRTTTSTPPRWRSRSPARWCSRRRSARPTRSCSSRSWPSRCARPRSTWATSSATSTPAVARSRPWRTSAAPRSSGPRPAVGDVRLRR